MITCCSIFINMQTDTPSQFITNTSIAVCSYCRNLSTLHLPNDFEFDLGIRYVDLLRGSSANCSSCELILQLSKGDYAVWKGDQLDATVWICFNYIHEGKGIHVPAWKSFPRVDKRITSIYLTINCPIEWPQPQFEIYTTQGQ